MKTLLSTLLLATVGLLCLVCQSIAGIVSPVAGEIFVRGGYVQVEWTDNFSSPERLQIWSVSRSEWMVVDWWEVTGTRSVRFSIPLSLPVGQYRLAIEFAGGVQALSQGYFLVTHVDGNPEEEVVVNLEQDVEISIRFDPSARGVFLSGQLDALGQVQIADLLGRVLVSQPIEFGQRNTFVALPDRISHGKYLVVGVARTGGSRLLATITHLR